MGGGQNSSERELTGVPVCGTSPWWHGEQEKGTGIPTPVGMRRWRGSDGGALVKGGGGGATSRRRCSRHGCEESRRAASEVWRGEDGGAFYRGGEVMVGRGDGQPSGSGGLSRGGRLRKRSRGD
jgi:hypothetical protein